MGVLYFFFYSLILLVSDTKCQMVQFGSCPQVDTVELFDIENFLGQWYIIEQFPTWFEETGHCSYKNIEACGRNIVIEHGFVKDNIQFILRWNSSYVPGDEAFFQIESTRVDPYGVPIAVIATDYTDFALIYGCQVNYILDIKFTSAWIMSRNKFLSEDTIHTLRMTLNKIPYINPDYLQRVYHDDEVCRHDWTAYVVQASENN